MKTTLRDPVGLSFETEQLVNNMDVVSELYSTFMLFSNLIL